MRRVNDASQSLQKLWLCLLYTSRKSEKFAQDLQESAIIIEKDNTDSKDTKKEKEEKEEPIPDAIDFDTPVSYTHLDQIKKYRIRGWLCQGHSLTL